MLLDPRDYAFTVHLERGFEVFRRECAALRREDFLQWPDRGAYGGEWLVAPLFMSSHIDGIEGAFAINQRRCGESTAWLRAFPAITSAVFSWMEPGCHIYPHRDVKAIEVLRAHLPLEVPAGAMMRVRDDVHTWEVGRPILFDGYIEHETGNTGRERRIVLLADACLADAEFVRLQNWRREHRIAIDPSLVLAGPFAREHDSPVAPPVAAT